MDAVSNQPPGPQVKAKIELTVTVDLETYAKYYGEEVDGETARLALQEAQFLLRQDFQAQDGRSRLPWFEVAVGHVRPELDPSTQEIADPPKDGD